MIEMPLTMGYCTVYTISKKETSYKETFYGFNGPDQDLIHGVQKTYRGNDTLIGIYYGPVRTDWVDHQSEMIPKQMCKRKQSVPIKGLKQVWFEHWSMV